MKTPIAALIMSASKKARGDDAASEPKEDTKALAGDVLSAVKSGDKAALADALEAFVHCCSMGSEDEYED